MRRGYALVLTACLLLAARAARAEQAYEGLDRRPLTVAEATQAALRAHRTANATSLAKLAAREDPPLWAVADRLRAAGEVEAARALAEAAPPALVGGLLTYVAGGPRDEDEALFALCEKAREALQDGRPEEVPEATPEVLALLRRPSVRAMSFYAMRGQALDRQRQAGPALQAYAAANRHADALHWPVGLVGTLHNLALARRRVGEARPAHAHEIRALEIAEHVGRPSLIASALGGAGRAEHMLGRYPEAVALLERELELRLRSPVPSGIGRVTGDLGRCYADLGDHPRALALLEDSLDRMAAEGDRGAEAWVLWRIAEVQTQLGDFDGPCGTWTWPSTSR